MTEEIKRKGRGPAKKPALTSTSIRLPKDVLAWFTATYPNSNQAKMREVLTDYFISQT